MLLYSCLLWISKSYANKNKKVTNNSEDDTEIHFCVQNETIMFLGMLSTIQK